MAKTEDSVTSDEFEHAVENVFSVRESYYKTYPDANDETKSKHIEEEVNKALKLFQDKIDHVQPGPDKDKMLYLKAKLQSLVPTVYPENEAVLTRHLKFHPFDTEAWNILGDFYWKKSDIFNSKNCFLKSLEVSRNTVALRGLSMLYRTLGGSREEVNSHMAESLQMAQEAVSLDVNDGRNWYVLGNVYTTMYFKGDQDPNHLKLSLKAYSNAARYDNVKNNPDFHYNKAVVHNYDGNYEEALISYETASHCDPNWPEPQKCISNLEKFLSNCQESITTRGRITARKLRAILKTLKTSDIGPYEQGMKKRVNGEIVFVPLELCSISSLALGANANKVVMGKVICQIYSPDALTFAFCMLEEDGPCYAVNVFNIAEGRGVKIGDSVAIPEPFVCDVDFKFKDKAYKFQWIKVDNPLLLVVNGKHMQRDSLAIPIMKTVFTHET